MKMRTCRIRGGVMMGAMTKTVGVMGANPKTMMVSTSENGSIDQDVFKLCGVVPSRRSNEWIFYQFSCNILWGHFGGTRGTTERPNWGLMWGGNSFAYQDR